MDSFTCHSNDIGERAQNALSDLETWTKQITDAFQNKTICHESLWVGVTLMKEVVMALVEEEEAFLAIDQTLHCTATEEFTSQ